MVINGLIFGLISTLHCAGMCGPLAMLQHQRGAGNKMFHHLIYQVGRVSMYTLIGLLVFMVGISFDVFRLQQVLSVVVGAGMVLFSLFSFIKMGRNRDAFLPFSKISKAFHLLQNKESYAASLGLGALNGLLPCGAVYVAAAYCTTFNSAADTMAYMGLFGIGTTPVFVAAWLLASKKFSFKLMPLRVVYKALPLIVGLLMILRGINLGIPGLSPELSQNHQKTEIKNCCKH